VHLKAPARHPFRLVQADADATFHASSSAPPDSRAWLLAVPRVDETAGRLLRPVHSGAC